MMSFAKFISVLGHPLFMPCYAFGLITLCNPYINVMIHDSVKQLTFMVLAIFTIVLPIFSAILLKQFGVISSIYMKDSNERMWPFVFTFIWYYIGYQLLSKLYIPYSFLLLMVGAISVIGMALIITLRWKVSVHMLGIGGVIGAVIGISHRYQFDHSSLIIGLVLFAGAVGFARLKTKSHNYNQVYVGFFIGLITEWAMILFF